jgi:hypothetical protein
LPKRPFLPPSYAHGPEADHPHQASTFGNPEFATVLKALGLKLHAGAA